MSDACRGRVRPGLGSWVLGLGSRTYARGSRVSGLGSLALAWLALCLLPGVVRAEGFAVGRWDVDGGRYRCESAARALYYLADEPYLAGAGSAEVVVTPRKRIASGGWAAAALLVSSDTQSFWTLSLVEGPDGLRYTELLESYQGIHRANEEGYTRLAAIEGVFGGTWEYGREYRLRLELAPEQITGTITPVGSDQPVARYGYRLGGAAALREGWAALRSEGLATEFASIGVDAAAAAPEPNAPALPRGARGSAGVYLGEDLPGAKPAPPLSVLESRLRAEKFAVTRLTSGDLASTLASPDLRVLVADVRRLPAAALEPLMRWIRRGGLLVSLAAPAFGELTWQDGGRWIDAEAHSQRVLGALSRGARPAVTWSDAEAAGWRQIVGTGLSAGAALACRRGALPDGGDALEVRLPHFGSGWWAATRSFEAPLARSGETLLCFQARGDGKTPSISIELTEKDGSRWVAVVELTDQWRAYALPPSAFAYWPDNKSQGRGGPGDALHPEQAVGIQIGISATHTPAVLGQQAAEHRFALGPLCLAKAAPEALKELLPPARPELEALSPGYKFYEMPRAARWEATELGRLWQIPASLPAAGAFALSERPQGAGFDRGRWWRWVPLVRARDASGADVGVPMALLLNETLPCPRAAWVSLGLRDASALSSVPLQEALAAIIDRATSVPMLFEAGARHFLWRPGEPIAVGARVLGQAEGAASAKVRFRLGRPGGHEVGALLVDAPVAAHALSAVSGSLPAVVSGDYRLTAELLVAGRVVDRVVHPLAVRARRTTPPADEDVVRRKGGALTLAGKPWHPVGANYWAHTLNGLPAGAYWTGWLSPLLYDPDAAEADLAQMESWGFRAIAAVGADAGWELTDDNPMLRNLEDFLWRCHRHHLKVFFFCRGLDPRYPDDNLARVLVRAVRNHPALAAYDIAWEPTLYDGRRRYTPQWCEWLVRQYGSLTAAEDALGHPLPRTAGGEVDVPPDEWCTKAGPWSAVTAAYRAFMNWQIGAGYRHSAALIRELDPVHLVGFRGSMVASPLGFLPVEQPAVLHFMDYAGPEAYDVPAYGRVTDWPILSAKGLVTRTLSFLSGGKPVVWMEFGMPVYPNGTAWSDALACVAPERLKYQAAEGRLHWRMQLESGAWGSFVWWYPGGFRVGENSDVGLVAPNNRPRPVVDAARASLARMDAAGEFRADTWMEMRPEANPGGWVGEYLRLRDEYARKTAAGKRVGVRTAGVGLTSESCPLVDPAGRKWPGRGPLRYLDGIFETLGVRVDGGKPRGVPLPAGPERVRVTVPKGAFVALQCSAGNLAEAAWQAPSASEAGGVCLRATGDVTAEAPLHAATPFQGSGAFVPLQLGRVERALSVRLRLSAGGRAEFGEVLEVEVVPE